MNLEQTIKQANAALNTALRNYFDFWVAGDVMGMRNSFNSARNCDWCIRIAKKLGCPNDQAQR